MRWPSPWGDGFPGWHLECSTMSMKYLGNSFDIHGGGLDNQFPHHECEIAQSEAATGRPFVKYWLHNNMVTVNGTKMSKSLGNFVTLKDAFRKFDPITVRFFILQSHYRSPLDYSNEAVEGAGKGLDRLKNVLRELRDLAEGTVAEADFSNLPEEPINLHRYYSEWLAAMADDFNTPGAIAVLFEMLKDINTAIGSGRAIGAEFAALTHSFIATLAGEVLGIIPTGDQGTSGRNIESSLINLFISLRVDARKNRDFRLADSIRSELQNMGVVLEDKKDGTTTFKVVR